MNIRLTSEAEATGVAELLEKPDFSKAEALEIALPDPIEAIKFRMEQLGLKTTIL